MITKEIWRDVPSVPEVLVSNKGRLMTTPFRGPMPNGGTRPYGGKPWAGSVGDHGRRIFRFRNRTLKVHRLVAEAFLGGPPFIGAVVMHLDENPSNNFVENLKWGTQKENLNAPGFLAYCRGRTGENSPSTKGKRKREMQ